MDLIAELAAFDGKHIDVLERIVARLPCGPREVRALTAIAASEDARLQTAATWLLKRYQEAGTSFAKPEVDRLLDLFDRVDHWEATLHLLQMLPAWAVPSRRREALHHHLMGLRNDTNKLVRAWAYNGLSVLATQFPAHLAEVVTLLDEGQRDAAASVRARIRNVLKTLKDDA